MADARLSNSGVAATGNIYAGLWYPVVVALATVVLGFLLVTERKDADLSA